MKKLLVVLTVALMGFSASALEIQRLDSVLASAYGANYYTVLTYADLAAQTNDNTALAITSTVPAKVGLQLVGMVLEQAFDNGDGTNTVNSVLLTIGDGSDADLFLTSTELAADGTEVFIKFGAPNAYTVTAATTNLIYTAGDASVKTQAVVTAVTSATAAAQLGQKYYAAAGSVVYTFTPDAANALSSHTKGRVRIYWRELK